MQRLWGLGVLLGLWLVPAGVCQTQAGALPERSMHELLDGARGASAPLGWDPTLSSGAAAYAAELEARGVLDHVGLDGQRVAGRLRELGVTEARLGEVLGAGPDARAVVEAWLASPPHTAVIRDATWTHVGVGRGPRGRVWVVVFASRRVADLVVTQAEGAVVVSGRFLAADVAAPVLLVDLDRHPPVLWRPVDGVFRFEPGALALGVSYVRLGYVSGSGRLRITNVIGGVGP